MLSKSLLLATATLLASANATLLWKPTTEAIAVDVSELVLNETLAVRADEVTYKGVGCDRIGLGQTDTNNARNAFISHCQGRTTSLYYYSGDTVAFYCQWHPGPQCDTGSANHAFDMITNQCGIDQGGSYSDNTESARTYSYGYTNWREHDYCNVPAGTKIFN